MPILSFTQGFPAGFFSLSKAELNRCLLTPEARVLEPIQTCVPVSGLPAFANASTAPLRTSGFESRNCLTNSLMLPIPLSSEGSASQQAAALAGFQNSRIFRRIPTVRRFNRRRCQPTRLAPRELHHRGSRCLRLCNQDGCKRKPSGCS